MKTSVLLSIDPSFLEETLKTAWPSILGFLYNLAFAAVIAFIGIRLIGYVKKWSRKIHSDEDTLWSATAYRR